MLPDPKPMAMSRYLQYGGKETLKNLHQFREETSRTRNSQKNVDVDSLPGFALQQEVKSKGFDGS